MAYLLNLATGRRLRLKEFPVTLGRARDNVFFLDDHRMSRHHVELSCDGDRFFLKDLGSTNGTFLNGKRMVGKQPLNHGDKFALGVFTFQFLFENAMAEPLHLKDVDPNLSKEQAVRFDMVEPGQNSQAALLTQYKGFVEDISDVFQADHLVQAVVLSLCRRLELQSACVAEQGREDRSVLIRAAAPDMSRSTTSMQRSQLLNALKGSGPSVTHDDLKKEHSFVVPVHIHEDVVMALLAVRLQGEDAPRDADQLHLLSLCAHEISQRLQQARVHAAMTELVEFNNNILHSMNQGFIVLDQKGQIFRFNDQLLTMLGYEESDLQDAMLSQHPSLHPLLGLIEHPPGRDERVRLDLETKQGGLLAVQATVSSLKIQRASEDKEKLRWLVTIEDLSAVEKLNAQVRRSEHLAAVGQMSAGIAHEIRNPLNGIRGFTQLIHKRVQQDPEAEKFCNIILNETDRLDHLVEQFLDLSRIKKLETQPCDLMSVLDHCLAISTAQAQDLGISIVKDLGNGPLVAQAHQEKLIAVFHNLIRNACEAMEIDGGSLEIKAQVLPGHLRGHDAIQIALSDTGPGMDDDVLHKIFLPFFSTKESGTGLGLALCQKDMEAMGGLLTVVSVPGVGTTFFVILPKAD